MLAIAILAAGKGTRMKSRLPKVLIPVAGRSLIERVLSSCEGLKVNRKFVIVGHKANEIKTSLKKYSDIEFVLQEPQNGTGHAIQQLIPSLTGFEGDLIVLNGDVPLIKGATIQSLLKRHQTQSADASIITSRIANPSGYGRVFVNEQGIVERIVEEKDCNNEQIKNTLTNAGIYCFNWKKLLYIVNTLSANNEQKEIYLTDAISKLKVTLNYEVKDPNEVMGINNKRQMANCESLIQEKLKNFWMEEGVTFTDPLSCTVSEYCHFGKNVLIEPQTHFRGICKIGDNCDIGPGSLIEDSNIGNDVKVINSVLNRTNIENNVIIGPYAHLRPETYIDSNCKIGNFVEIKKSKVGMGSKINHLSYLGDTICGKKVNIGAGTITANFDGEKKHQTIIGNQCKTGANSVLVAPIKLGDNVTIGAGSTLTKDIPKGALAITRAKEFIKENWK